MQGPLTDEMIMNAVNAVWVLTSTCMIFFMQAGFALVECGSVRSKNGTSILLKNLFDACAGCIGWWLVGYGFAFSDGNGFIGGDSKYFASSGFDSLPEDNYIRFVF